MRPPTRTESALTDRLLAFVMMLGIYVSIEPAPFDVAIVLTGVLLMATRRLSVPRTSVLALLLLLIFGLANLLSLALMSGPTTRTYIFLAVTIYLLVLWLVVVMAQGIGRGRSTDAMLWGYAVSGAVAGGAGILAYVGVPVIGPLMVPDGRLHGLFKDPNVYGAYLVPVVLLGVANLVGRRGSSRVGWTVALGLAAGAIFLSFSRGSWVNLAVGLFMFFVLHAFAEGLAKVWWRTAVFLPPLLLLAGIAAYQLMSLQAVQDMFTMRFGMQNYDTLRFAIQAQATDVALQNPLGLGPGTTETTFAVAAHSTYVRGLVENGLLGVASLVGFMALSGGRTAWLAVSSAAAEDRLRFAVIAGALCGMFVEAAVIDTIHWRHFWLFLAFAWCPPGKTKRTLISNTRIR